MKLISGLLSNNAAKVRIALAEKGIDYECHEVPWTRKRAWEPKPQILLDSNPRAEVPVLIDGDLTVWDSTVINEYIESKYPEPALMPADIGRRGLCRLWEDEGDNNQVHVGVLITEVFMAEPGTPLSAEADNAIKQLVRFMDRLETQLGEKDYICGEFSLADISVFMTLAFASTMGTEITQPAVQQWFARMLERPVVGAEFEAVMAGAAAA